MANAILVTLVNIRNKADIILISPIMQYWGRYRLLSLSSAYMENKPAPANVTKRRSNVKPEELEKVDFTLTIK